MDQLDWVLPFLAIFVVLPTVYGLWVALVPHYKARRMQAAADEPLPSDECVACGSRDVEVVASGVIRCRLCDFLSGEGIAAWNRARRLQELARLSPEERRAHAIDQLRQARRALTEAERALDAAASASVADIAGFSVDRGAEKQTDFVAALRHMSMAQNLASEAAECARIRAPISGVADIADSSLLLALDTAWLTDGWIVDCEAHARIGDARSQLREIEYATETLLGRLGAA